MDNLGELRTGGGKWCGGAGETAANGSEDGECPQLGVVKGPTF